MTYPIDTTPLPARGWTPELKVRFLDRLSRHGNARAACRAVGLSAEAAYRLRRRDPLFARGWAAALVLGRDASEQALGERAVEGVEEEIYYRGELIGTRRRFDSRLLLAHLARLDRLAEESAGEDAGRFDELLACIAGDEASLPQGDRQGFIDRAAADAGEAHRRQCLADYAAEKHREDDQEEPGEPDLLAPCDDERDNDRYDLEFTEMLEDECREEAERARREAGREWDRQARERLDTIDRLCGVSPSPLVGQAGPVPAAVARVIEAAVADPREKPGFDGTANSPRTLSTVSTSALSRALAGTPIALVSPSFSPFSAPRRTGSPGASAR